GGQGQYSTILGWLEALPESVVRGHARLSLMYAMALRATNQLEAGEARLQDAERCLQVKTSEEQSRIIRGWVTVMRASLALSTGDVTRCVTLARQALELLPETMAPLRSGALMLLGHEYLATGEVTAATERVAAETVALTRSSVDLSFTLRSLTNLARVQALQGRLHRALVTYEEAARVAPDPHILLAPAGSRAYYV